MLLGASDNPLVSALNEHNNVARFHPDFEAELNKPGVLDAIVQELLVEHFSETQFEDIIEACELRPKEVVLYKR
ncbi:MAG: hypothetical protein RLZZ599_1151, partial [Bacteroidota bacterium]